MESLLPIIDFDKDIFNEVYLQTYYFPKRYLLLYGSAGSGKSEWAAQKLLIRTMKESNHRFLYYRKVAKTIRGSQFQLFNDIITRWKIASYFKINKGDMSIEYLPNKNKLIAHGIDEVEKLKSITSITGTWGEETTEIEEDEFKQIDLRMRGITENYKQHIFTFNPIDDMHWINKKWFIKKITQNG